MSRVVIRAMIWSDIPQVSAIDRQSFLVHWAPETFGSEVSNSIGYYRVAEREGQVVGYIGSHMVLDEAHITTFGVDPAARRQHIGELLLADVLRQAIRCGCVRITLEVREGNTPAQNLYKKYGFSPVSRRKRYYPDNDEDAIVMWIEDTNRYGFRTLYEERVAALKVALTQGPSGKAPVEGRRG